MSVILAIYSKISIFGRSYVPFVGKSKISLGYLLTTLIDIGVIFLTLLTFYIRPES